MCNTHRVDPDWNDGAAEAWRAGSVHDQQRCRQLRDAFDLLFDRRAQASHANDTIKQLQNGRTDGWSIAREQRHTGKQFVRLLQQRAVQQHKGSCWIGRRAQHARMNVLRIKHTSCMLRKRGEQ